MRGISMASMIKLLVGSATIVFVLSLTALEAGASCASAPVVSSTYPLVGPMTSGTDIRSTDPVGPFPLSALAPFPWASIDGIWTMKLPDGTKLHFSFEAHTACDGRKFVKILGFDQKSYRVTADGFGLEQQDARTVRAVMTSATSQYLVFVRQFKIPQGKMATKTSTVVTIRPFNGDWNNDVHMTARKASSLTLPEYLQRESERQREVESRRAAEVRRKSTPIRREF